MSKKKSKLELAQEETESAIKKTNGKISELGEHTFVLFDTLSIIQAFFDSIRNVPTKERLEYERLKKIDLNWKQQAEKIDSDYKSTAAKNAGGGAVGVGAGVAVAALGPAAAMGIATTFGVASTGTAISTLGGAAATNAALAWLGGGALAAGGGGIAAGNAFLALAGPVGLAIAGVAIVSSGVLFLITKSDQNRLEDIFTLISKRDIKSYELAVIELNERIDRIKDESAKLTDAIEKIRSFGQDYEKMTEAQQYALGSYVNLMSSSTQLLTNSIMGLQPKYSDEDFERYKNAGKTTGTDERQKALIISLANLLYKIDLDEKDKKLLWKSFKGNRNFLDSIDASKKSFGFSIIETACDALEYKYGL